jgi:hypothetical protein
MASKPSINGHIFKYSNCSSRFVRPRIPETIRMTVIEKWMLGYPRNTIAVECGISNGTVTSIADEWRNSTGVEMAELIRIMGVTLRKLRISPFQCLTGLGSQFDQ